MTNEELKCKLQYLVALANRATIAAERGDWQGVTDILQGKVTPLVQQTGHEVWLRYHKSGTAN